VTRQHHFATMPREVTRVGAYALRRTLGKGAFGWVKLAVQDKTGAKVAIKARRRRHAIDDASASNRRIDDARATRGAAKRRARDATTRRRDARRGLATDDARGRSRALRRRFWTGRICNTWTNRTK